MSDSPITFINSTSDLSLEQAKAIATASTGNTATSLIEYHSAGYCLVVGDAEVALDYVELLAPLKVVVATVKPEASQSVNKKLTSDGVQVYECSSLRVHGHLGKFEAAVPTQDNSSQETHQLGVMALTESGYFDMVLDLGVVPQVSSVLPPFGYYRVTDEASRLRCIEEMPGLIGEFEKPKYFNHDASICAHSRSQIAGCNNCIDVCLTSAISSAGDTIRVDPYLCQGCGHCATVCPSGAMTYAYPGPADAITRTREMIANADNEISVLVLYTSSDVDMDEQDVDNLVADESQSVDSIQSLENDEAFEQSLPSHVLALAVDEIGGFGMDYWATMIAGGIQRVVLLTDSQTHTRRSSGSENTGDKALKDQIEILHTILAGTALEPQLVRLIDRRDSVALQEALLVDNHATKITPASFSTHNDKRQTFRFAIDHLTAQFPAEHNSVELPAGSPFGVISVDKDACTLCLACVSTCPAGALLDGQQLPQLKFIEANCVQCGICESACPENALTLTPGYRFDSMQARAAEILNEEAPFNCVLCHKPFATRKMIDNMTAKLAGHWMFEDETRMRRLKMCEDCRVKDMFEKHEGGIPVHRDS